jgi:putative inorganic carbon (HCO3(-)) transporter
MNSVWQQVTLSNLPLHQWRETSYVYRLVGSLQEWRQSSWLMQWAEPIGVLLVSSVFVLSPFIPNEIVGVLLFGCAAFWVLLSLADQVNSPDGAIQTGFTPIHLLVLLYWTIATLATALSPVKAAAVVGLTKLTLYLLLFVMMARILRSPRLRSWLITIYLHVATFVSIYGMRQWFFGATALATWVDPESPLSKTTRVYSYLGNPNLLAGYLVPAIALSIAAVFAWRGWLPKALALLMAVLNSSCLILTFSRGGWIGLVVVFFAFAILFAYWWSVYLPSFWRTWLLPALLGGLIGILILGMLFVAPLRDRVSSMFVGRQDSSNNFRINVWAAVTKMIRDRPILGIGPGNTAFNKVYPIYQVSPRYTALSAYSILLEICVETGVLGASCFLWLLLVTFNQGAIQLQRLRDASSAEGFWLMAAIAAMLGMLAHGLFDTVWYRPEVNTLWWLMVALVASYYQPKAWRDLGNN